MFGNARNAISAYQKVGIDAAVEVADPYRLILLLFAGAQAAIGKARAAMQQNRSPPRGKPFPKPSTSSATASRSASMWNKAANSPSASMRSTTTWSCACCAPTRQRSARARGSRCLLEEIHGAWREISPHGAEKAVA
jgi:flagellar protein FliS